MRRSSRSTRSTRAYALYLIPSAVLFAAVIGVPFFMNIGISLTHWQGVGSPSWAGVGNYTTLFQDSAFWQSFEHNLVLLVAMAIIPAAVGLILAYALFEFVAKRFSPRVAAVVRACIYLPQILPIAVVGIVWSWVLAPDDGALDQFLDKVGLGSLAQDWLGNPKLALLSVGAVMIWFQVGYPMVIFMSGLQRVDPSLYEAADLDGATWYRKLWNISMPQIRAEISVVLLTCTIAALKVFPQIFVLTRGGPGGSTNVPSYYSYQEFFEKTQVGYGAAISTVLTVLILLLTAVFIAVQNRGNAR